MEVLLSSVGNLRMRSIIDSSTCIMKLFRRSTYNVRETPYVVVCAVRPSVCLSVSVPVYHDVEGINVYVILRL